MQGGDSKLTLGELGAPGLHWAQCDLFFLLQRGVGLAVHFCWLSVKHEATFHGTEASFSAEHLHLWACAVNLACTFIGERWVGTRSAAVLENLPSGLAPWGFSWLAPCGRL